MGYRDCALRLLISNYSLSALGSSGFRTWLLSFGGGGVPVSLGFGPDPKLQQWRRWEGSRKLSRALEFR